MAGGQLRRRLAFLRRLYPKLAAQRLFRVSSPRFNAIYLRGRDFDRRRYWRGPVWINTDWLVWRGLRQHGQTELAGEIEASMTGLVERSGFREYYDPFSARGYGTDQFSRTAALLLDVLLTQAGGLRR